MGSEDLIALANIYIKMLSVKIISIVFSMALVSDGRVLQQKACSSCCPPSSPPDEDSVTCEKLGEHLGILDEAIAECNEVEEGQQSDEVCNAFTKTIPSCMVLKGSAEQSECLAEKAIGLGDEEIATSCKCRAFRNIKNTVSSVKNMMCVDLRKSRSFGYGYGMNTIWFQYLLCKDLSFTCYFFTQGWNQGDFGQYYLYENLLDSSAGISDDTLLTLAVVGGGLGGGYRPQYAPTHGHYYPPPPEPEPESEPEHEPEPVPLHRRRRSSSDEPITEASTSRRRRQATPTEASPSRRRRQVTPTEASPSPSRRRRQVTPTEASPSPYRRRRQVTSTDASPSRRRRQVTSTEASPSRRRRDAPTTESSSKPT